MEDPDKRIVFVARCAIEAVENQDVRQSSQYFDDHFDEVKDLFAK
jgi:hypothetical protein